MTHDMTADGRAFLAARDFLLDTRVDYATAARDFRWPRLTHFNWALDYFDVMAAGNDWPALWIVDEGRGEQKFSFQEMAHRSAQVANHLRELGVRRGDPILLMLGNEPALWETMLAAIKLGAVVIPSTGLLTPADLADRIERGGVRHIVAGSEHTAKFESLGASCTRICVGGPQTGWRDFEAAHACSGEFTPDGPTPADDPLFLYFTSGTTSRPKMVVHTHQSYPVGHLSTMYWIGLQPGDIHLNLSSPGWAKHAWSCFFAPWNAGACVAVHNVPRFDAAALLAVLERLRVTTFCAPPTVWRMLVQQDLADWRHRLALGELVGAGEPLNPEIIAQVEQAWNITIRDGYGQTETSALIANAPGQELTPGSMGRPLPGFRISLLDADDREADEGEVCVGMDPPDGRPVGVMQSYLGDAEKTAKVMRDGVYHSGDVAVREADGKLTFVGRADDVFKASDYRISPFELESVLIEHVAVTEAAVVPSPDPLRLAVPKAFVTLTANTEMTPATARDIFAFTRSNLAPYKRIRRLEFVTELPKTISGKIRRVELRRMEIERRVGDAREPGEHFESDFPDLREDDKHGT